MTDDLWTRLNTGLAAHPIPDWVTKKVCVYVTGSVARNEASGNSDLDAIVIDDLPGNRHLDPRKDQLLSRVDQAHLLASLDHARKEAKFREFSRGGDFLIPHSLRTMVEEIGAVGDDYSNRFTARVLLLINSRPLVNGDQYQLAREEVLHAYWRRAESPDKEFFPVYLLNDLRRWWHYLLLNFERDNPPAQESDNPKVAAKRRSDRRIANLKLRYARLLGAYTPIVGVLAASKAKGITVEQMREVLDATPTGRLDHIRREQQGTASALAHALLKGTTNISSSWISPRMN